MKLEEAKDGIKLKLMEKGLSYRGMAFIDDVIETLREVYFLLLFFYLLLFFSFII